MGTVHECGQQYIHVHVVCHHVMPGVGGRVHLQDNCRRRNVYKERNHDNIYSAEDCGISTVMIIFI